MVAGISHPIRIVTGRSYCVFTCGPLENVMSLNVQFEIKRCKKVDGCEWCGENIESGEVYTQMSQTFKRGTFPVRTKMHTDCSDALENAWWHDTKFVFVKHEQEKGQYPCPSGNHDCEICECTPFRHFKAGWEKPALAALNA